MKTYDSTRMITVWKHLLSYCNIAFRIYQHYDDLLAYAFNCKHTVNVSALYCVFIFGFMNTYMNQHSSLVHAISELLIKLEYQMMKTINGMSDKKLIPLILFFEPDFMRSCEQHDYPVRHQIVHNHHSHHWLHPCAHCHHCSRDSRCVHCSLAMLIEWQSGRGQ